jgi:hypothetical protein
MNSKGKGKVSEIFPNHSDDLSFLGEEILTLRNKLNVLLRAIFQHKQHERKDS